MPIYAFRYERRDPETNVVRQRDSFIKHASSEAEARKLAEPHLEYHKKRTGDKLVLTEVVEHA